MDLIVSFSYRDNHVSSRDFSEIHDVRSLRNPHSNRRLRALNGLDPKVREVVLSDPRAEQLIQTIIARNPDTVAIGCTGGRHRSVVIAQEIANRMGCACLHMNKKTW